MKKHIKNKKKHISRIGLFDSGVGGLFLLKELSRRFSNKTFLYLMDRAGFPYGEKSPEQIYALVKNNIGFLTDQGAEQIITACNTACSVLKKKAGYYPVPVKEIISASLKQADKSSLNKKIGLLATTATVQSGIFLKKAKELNKGLKIYQKACPKLAPFVEREIQRKKKEDTTLFSLLEEYLNPLLNQGVDTVILGCTHYLYLKKAVERFLGKGKKAVGPVEFLLQDLQTKWTGQEINKRGAVSSGGLRPRTALQTISGKAVKKITNIVLPGGDLKIHFFIRDSSKEFEKQCLKIWHKDLA